MLSETIQRSKAQAQQAVERFVRRFEPSYRLLAWHAALPLVLTPELLNYLRNQFLSKVPWEAEADLLLSDLCQQVGYEIYVMDAAVRACLLEKMAEDDELGPERMQAVARLLISYVKHLEQTQTSISQQELRTQQWAAMVYLDDQREVAVKEIAEAFESTSQPGAGERRPLGVNRSEMARLARITQDLAPQLREYQSLVNYANVVGRALQDPAQVVEEDLQRRYSVLQDFILAVPAELMPGSLDLGQKWPALKWLDYHVKTITIGVPFPDLSTQSFDIVTLTKQEPDVTSSIRWQTEKFSFITLEQEPVRRQRIKRMSAPWVIKRHPAQATKFIESAVEGLELEMVLVKGGTFQMGSSDDDPDAFSDEKPQHKVTVTPFCMGKYSITQAQWRVVADLPQVNRELKAEPSHFKGDHRPVENISWYDAVEFCDRLSRETDCIYRLPTEAEWEHACRGGTTTPLHLGEMITTEVANYNGTSFREGPNGRSRGQTIAVDELEQVNAFGLYDMHGNVWEWCQDHWHENYNEAPTDGSAWLTDDKAAGRIVRGGSWSSYPRYCRCVTRSRNDPDDTISYLGFRVVCNTSRTLS